MGLRDKDKFIEGVFVAKVARPLAAMVMDLVIELLLTKARTML